MNSTGTAHEDRIWEAPSPSELIGLDWEFRTRLAQLPAGTLHSPSMIWRACGHWAGSPQCGPPLEYRRPILAATPELAGYTSKFDWQPASWLAGFVRVGAEKKENDFYWDTRSKMWFTSKTRYNIQPASWYVARPFSAVQTIPTLRWRGCRHKRDSGAVRCNVCAAFGRLTVE